MKEVYILKSDLNEWIAKYFKNDLISISMLLGCIEDLDHEVDRLKDKIKDLENDEPFEPYSEYGVSERDFH